MRDGDAEFFAEQGRRVRRPRVARNMTQAQLAEKSGVSVRTIASIEAGRSDLRFLTYVLVMVVLVEDPEEMMGGVRWVTGPAPGSGHWEINPPPFGPLA
jgi:hypothetical protein